MLFTMMQFYKYIMHNARNLSLLSLVHVHPG